MRAPDVQGEDAISIPDRNVGLDVAHDPREVEGIAVPVVVPVGVDPE